MPVSGGRIVVAQVGGGDESELRQFLLDLPLVLRVLGRRRRLTRLNLGRDHPRLAALRLGRHAACPLPRGALIAPFRRRP
jgi:hypothetical protein